MKVLHIHPSMSGGGIESMICGLANEMAKSHDVTVCSIFSPVESDLFWYKLSSDVKKATLGKVNRGFSLKEIYKVCKFIGENNFDVVYLHGSIQYYVMAIMLLHGKVKFCYTMHTDAQKENIGWSGRLYRFKKFCFANKWVTPITISSPSRQSFVDLYQCESKLIYNGVPRPKVNECVCGFIEKYKITQNTKVFLHPGRITEAKNQEVLCKVFKQIIDEGADVVLLIAGPNDDNDIYTKINYYFCERIVYLGQCDDIPSMLAYADAMCLPSIWEGMPVTLLEALSVGCIPICSPVGGIVDVINNGVNGVLSASSSAEDYYAAMKVYMSYTDEDINKMKQSSRESFEKYDIANASQEYIGLAL